MAKSKSKMADCNAACELRYMNQTRNQLMKETQKAERLSSSITLGGMRLASGTVTEGQIISVCSANMVKAGNICGEFVTSTKTIKLQYSLDTPHSILLQMRCRN